VFLAAPGFDGEETEARSAEVVAFFWLPVGKNEGRVVLQFAGIDTISDAESVAGTGCAGSSRGAASAG